MQLTDADRDLILDALFAYGMMDRVSPQGMRAQELYRLLKDAQEFCFAPPPIPGTTLIAAN